MTCFTKLTIACFLSLLCMLANAQTAQSSLTGLVTDNHDKPIDAALVWLVTPDATTSLAQAITDPDGKFSIPCMDKEVKLMISCLGYSTYTSEVFNAKSTRTFQTVVLSEEFQELDDVVIIGEKLPHRRTKGRQTDL